MKEATSAKRERRLEKYRAFAEGTGRHYIHESSITDKNNPIPRWGVSKVQKKKARKVLIVGTGRCGTDYISRVFLSNGYEVLHERVGEFGCSSHWFITDSEWYPVLPFTAGLKAHVGERKNDYTFDKTIHLVRDPLTTIKSITNIFRATDYDFLKFNKVIPEGIDLQGKKRIYRGMVTYFYVNKFIQRSFPKSQLIQIEKINSHMRLIESILNIPPLKIPSDNPTNTSKNILGFRRSKKDVTFNCLKAADFKLAASIWKLAKELGYSL